MIFSYYSYDNEFIMENKIMFTERFGINITVGVLFTLSVFIISFFKVLKIQTSILLVDYSSAHVSSVQNKNEIL